MLKAFFAAGLALAAATTAARAANPEFCAAYAQAAVNQARAARANPACAPGLAGTRWSGEYGVHYGWCITAPGPAVAEEREMRTRYLRSCRG
ncbi:MAG TPA: hypothetical protein VGC38_03460 [Pseudolabrys sp.]